MKIKPQKWLRPLSILLLSSIVSACSQTEVSSGSGGSTYRVPLPTQVTAIMQKALYKNSSWALRVTDSQTGQVLFDQDSDRQYLIGSVRKLFSTAVLLNQLGSSSRFQTKVYRTGPVDVSGTLQGNLILVSSGDFVMGGRRAPQDSIELAEIDHSEANAVGNALATKADPLAGYRDLATSVAQSGITAVNGQVIIDDRLYQPFNFRDQFQANCVFVNDNLIDIQMNPTSVGQAAVVNVSPITAAFPVTTNVTTTAGTLAPNVTLSVGPDQSSGSAVGSLPIQANVPLTGGYPYLQTFRVLDPSSHARTVLIEQLQRAGVQVAAPTVAKNPSNLLPQRNSYSEAQRVAQLTSSPLSEYVRYILKVSYNLGADTALMLFGTTQGANTMERSLQVEQERLQRDFGILPTQYTFVDGSGGGDSKATLTAVVQLLQGMRGRPDFTAFRDGLPVIGEPGVISAVPAISNDPSLAGSIGQVLAKTGTFATGDERGISLKARAIAGYITSKGGRQLNFMLVVNNVGPFTDFLDTIEVNHDLDVIGAILWREL